MLEHWLLDLVQHLQVLWNGGHSHHVTTWRHWLALFIPGKPFLVVSLLLSLLSLILEDTVGYRYPNCGRAVHIHVFSVFGPSVSFCVKYYLKHKENFLKTSEDHNNFKIKGYTFRGLFDTMMFSKIIWAISISGTWSLQSWVLSHIAVPSMCFLLSVGT